MPAIRLPIFDQSLFQEPIEKQVKTLADFIMRYRRELEWLLNGQLDESNGVNSTVGDLTSVWTSINQTNTDISLLAGDVAGNTSSIQSNAQEISLKVSSTDYNGDQIVSRINMTSSNVMIQSGYIDLIGATTFRTGSTNDYININQNVLTINEGTSGLAKIALGFIPDRNNLNIPALVLGAGDGYGNNRGYITKDADSLDIFHVSDTGIVSFISLGNGQIRLNDNIIPVADQNGKLIDDYIYSATSWNAKLDEITMKTSLQDPLYDIVIPKENIGVLDVENINIDYAQIAQAVIEDLIVGTAQIQDLAVTTAKIDNASITSAKIGSLQVTDAHIANLAVTSAKIDDLAVTNAKIGNLSVSTAKIEDLAVSRAKIGNAAIGSAQIDSAVITYAHIANATIKTANIESAAITTALIATGAIQTAQISDGSITDAKIVDLTANKITAGTLSVERLIIRDPVTPANSLIYAINNISGALQSVVGDTLNGEILTPRTITADRIVAGAITANEIAASTITANKIAANTITAASGVIASIDASKITTGTLSADRISGGTITGVTINIATDATVGDDLFIGTGAYKTRIVNVNGTGYLYNSNTIPALKFWGSGSVWCGEDFAIANGSSIGVYNAGIGGSTWSSLITLSQTQISLVPGSTAVGVLIGGSTSAKLGFFGTTPTTKRTVADPSATTVTTAPASYTQTWGGQVYTDIRALRATLLTLIDALQAYGLIA